LVDDQDQGGYWRGHDLEGNQFLFETAWAVIMLRRTVVQIPPEARAEAFPNPVLAGQVVTFDGSTSTAAPGRSIVRWEWDLDNNGTFESVGVTVTRTFPSNGTYQVTLRVMDNTAPVGLTDTATVDVVVRNPPVAPTANAGGPYNFCTNRTPWFLDARGSINPDEGASEPGKPGNTITQYAWELNGNNMFDDASGLTPNVTGLFTVNAVPYLIQLRVTDNSGISHPSFGGNLSDTHTAQVFVRNAADPDCSCVSNLAARPKPGKADLTWSWRLGAVKYNVYRGTTSGGPYQRIGVVTAPGLSNTGVYADMGPLTSGLTYYYIVREAALNNEELCTSNQASATPAAR
jgi:PKD repeat protein